MAKKPHPADLAQEAIIRNAIRYEVALFLGTGRYAHGTAPTLTEARIEAKRLAVENPGNGRKAMIYAVDASEKAALVTDSFQPQKEIVQ